MPTEWREGVEAVPLPGFDNVGEVLTAFIDQTARLQMANDRTRDALSIIEKCEAMRNQAGERKFLGVF